MKIIGLMPVKNEAWILPATIPQFKRFVDEILVLDTGSDDGTQKILKNLGVEVKPGAYDPGHHNNYATWRNTLLDWGRQKKGTHFVWLDADEALTSQLLPSFRNYLAKLKPGQKLILDWLCLWKSPCHLRIDSCVWKKIAKDFAVCDDGASRFCETLVRHEGRTPGVNHPKNQIIVPRSAGAVLHYQFVPFQRFQMKQAFQRVRELLEHVTQNGEKYEQAALAINRNYAITLDDPKARCIPMAPDWYDGMTGLGELSQASPGWYEDAIIDFFSRKPIEWFEPLQIWHIPSLRENFLKQAGRKPVSMEIPRYLKMRSLLRTRVVNPMIQFLRGSL